MNSITGIILAGGKSKQIGNDKAFFPLQGKRLIEHTIDLFKARFSEIIISTNSGNYLEFGYTVVKDEIPDCGPIGGIYSALKKSKNDWAMVSGCDTPFISEDVLTRLIGYIDAYDSIVSVHHHQKEPLVALYHKYSLSVFLENIKEKNYNMNTLLEKLNCRYVDVSDLVESNPSLFLNFNSPADITELPE